MVILSKIIHLILANCQENIQMEHQQRSYLEHKNNIQLNRYIIYLLLVDNFIYVVIVMDWVPEISVRRQIGDAFSSYFVPKKIKKIYVQLWANSRYPFHVYLYSIRDIDFIGSFLKFLEELKLRKTSRYSSINILRSPSNFELARLGLKKHCLLLSSWSIKKRVIKCKKGVGYDVEYCRCVISEADFYEGYLNWGQEQMN